MRSASLTAGTSVSWGQQSAGLGTSDGHRSGCCARQRGCRAGGGLLGRVRYQGGEYSSWVYMVDAEPA